MDRSPSRAPSPTGRERARAMQRTTLVAVITNSLLALGQIVVGIFAHAFSLVADAAHTLSDLVTDVLVLSAGRRGAEPADRDHPYGHGRIETATTLLLGSVLAFVGLGFLWSSGVRLQNMADAPALHPAALYMALATLLAKEGLFRYTLGAARRLRAPLLEANAWHARSDAASSLVVAAGIGGSLAGYPFLEPLAAAVVGFLILNMGARLAWKALRELIDTGLPAEQIAKITRTVRETPGVVGVHELRTRRMADRVLCDAHVQVDPRISVSEGHRISDMVYFRIRDAHPDVRDVLVHVDAEHDGELQVASPGQLPDRPWIKRAIDELFSAYGVVPERILIHYLGQRIEVEAMLAPGDRARIDPAALKQSIEILISRDPTFRSIHIFERIAP
ncbi:MAG: cation diffusion facilitator family transporter [Rhodocyclaceae bacterium]|nr:cation diffusion facilitator family transporter [Rhodocyclaceae bacterium]